tara:strand:- start:652 stop:2526 length:1875 start_codon:yes stop_codon:yes gene_type:complete
MKTFKEIPKELPITNLMDSLDLPEGIKNLTKVELNQLADEVREYLLYSVGRSGGHFGAGLGVIELTIALHHVFNSPEDKIVWDVGHQTYPHKILTGRKNSIESIRKKDGLHPFPSRDESPHDAFGVGHSSTSISAALGMARGDEDSNNKNVAVIGDGAITGGMAFEALAHAGSLEDEDLLIVLNDNNMSISNNIGGISNYLNKIWSSKWYTQIREGGKKAMRFIPSAKRFASKAEIHFKGMFTPGAMFEELGFHYIGPIDGHDLNFLVETLKNLENLKGPKFLHVITTKGKGFVPAEADPIGYHAISKMPSPEETNQNKKAKYSDIFGEWACEKASKDIDFVAITPAMTEGSGLVNFSKTFPNQFYDVAIAEQHSMTFAAGLACAGKKPVLAIYSTFLQRAYDQLIHDVAIQNLNVLLAIDRAGFVGEDGATHAGIFDLTYLRCVPNLTIMTPSNEDELWKMLNTGYTIDGPVAVRYPRGSGPGEKIENTQEILSVGKAKILREKESNLAILSFGSLLNLADEIANELDCSLIDMRFVKPLDEDLITKLARKHELLVTLEENMIAGGAGSAVNEFLNISNVSTKILNVGIPDNFPSVGSPSDQKTEADLEKTKIIKQINKKLNL